MKNSVVTPMRRLVAVVAFALVLAFAQGACAELLSFGSITIDVPAGWRYSNDSNGNANLLTPDGLYIGVENIRYENGTELQILAELMKESGATEYVEVDTGTYAMPGPNDSMYMLRFYDDGEMIAFTMSDAALAEKHAEEIGAILGSYELHN